MTERHWRYVVVIGSVLIAGAQWARIMVNAVGDFRLHWLWGARFVHGQFLYDGGANIPYLPFWAVPFAPLSLLPVQVAQALVYPVAVCALLGVLAILQAMTRDAQPLSAPRVFWLGVLAIAVASRYVLRDLSEAGPNTMLVALTWLAIWAWWRGRYVAGGAILGTVIALKLTAVLFLVYFVARRQWRFATSTIVAAVTCTLSPALWMGTAFFGQHVAAWRDNVWTAATSTDPRIGVLGLEPSGNLALRPALTRYLMHIPEGVDGQGRFVHPLNIDVLTLPPHVATPIIVAALITLVIAVVWALRSNDGRLRSVVAWDAAAVAILALLLSPITWRQHCVAIVPACFLIGRQWLRQGHIPKVAIASALTLMVVSLLFSRGLMGEVVSSLVQAYYLHTAALVLLLAGVIACRNQERHAAR